MTVASGLEQRFERLFGRAPSLSAQAPGRVNLIGDHTDYNDGLVLPAGIPQHTTILAAVRRDGGATEAVSETLDSHVRYDEFNVASGFARYVAAGIKVIEERGVVVPPLSLLVSSDIPVGAGLSSSASLEVALIRVIDGLLGLHLGPVDIAMLAHRAEVVHVGVMCGIMDQMASSIAAPDRMLLLDTRSMAYELRPLPAGAQILVIDSGTRRSLLTSGYNSRIEECRAAAAALGVKSLREILEPAAVERLDEPLRRRARYVLAENARVAAAAEAAAAEFGRLMCLSHAGLRDEFEVVAPAVDTLVRALGAEPGVYGARMTGAGFGGACVALVEEGRAAEIGRRVVACSGVAGAAVLIPSPAAASPP